MQHLPNPMDIRLLLVFLVLGALPLLSRSLADAASNSTRRSGDAAAAGAADSSHTCNGLVGECISEDEEQQMMGQEAAVVHRALAQRSRFISYDVLDKNNVPCNRRGSSYYNCIRSGRANPYRRGCSAITHCKRYTK